ncbi:hypothetical protein CYMTET_4016 [Cymbomonas tetramitiformis]|uniref:C2 domain-containing protein n=1 Tax=Cymbomonas tetramitiformis TaxID=36881 RepID=A0AAE0LKG6_9CHLO|nr:hypothetical protein CYMTET_4016 [Cymbomonas tetramitiformis]
MNVAHPAPLGTGLQVQDSKCFHRNQARSAKRKQSRHSNPGDQRSIFCTGQRASRATVLGIPGRHERLPVRVQASDDSSSTSLVSAGLSTSLYNFDFETASVAAGLSFETYSEPVDSRWEKGSKGCNVAFKSESYTRSLYGGLLEVTLLEARNLPEADGAAESMLSGKGSDAYVLMALVESGEEADSKELAKNYREGVLALNQASNVVRSSTVWANGKDKSGNEYFPGKDGGKHVWGGEEHSLYLRDPLKAQLVITVLDENLVSEDPIIGSASLSLNEFLGLVTRGEDDVAEGSGWIPLTFKPPSKEGSSGQMAAGATAGAMVAGPAGAAIGAVAGGLAGAFFKNQVNGEVRLNLKYTPLPKLEMERSKGAEQRVSVTEGVDWNMMRDFKGVAQYELCCFVTHAETGCTAGVYRDPEAKKLAVAFRGTCAPVDLITDVSLIQTPWVEGEEGAEEQVHAGFRSSLQSVSRRLKELVIAAAGDSVEGWELLLTGHSLGGALATLFAADVGENGLDSGRGLPTKAASDPWYTRLIGFLSEGEKAEYGVVPRPRSVRVYTFGSPRVGNDAFAARFECMQLEMYRIVNGADVVARLPRSMNALVASVGYDHCGKTVLIGAGEDSASLWVEGESSAEMCPVRDGTPTVNPFRPGNPLGDLQQAAKTLSSEVDLMEYDSSDPGASALGWQQKARRAGEILGKVGAAADAFKTEAAGRLQDLTPSEAASLLGIDSRYISRELDIMGSITSGDALTHHLEPAYFEAMRVAYVSLQPESAGLLPGAASEPSCDEPGTAETEPAPQPTGSEAAPMQAASGTIPAEAELTEISEAQDSGSPSSALAASSSERVESTEAAARSGSEDKTASLREQLRAKMSTLESTLTTDEQTRAFRELKKILGV